MENQYVNLTASILPGIIAIANRSSLSVDVLLEKAGLTQEQINDPNSQLSLSQFDNVLEVMKEASKDPALGLHHGLTLQLNSLQRLGTLLATSSTLQQVFDHYAKYKDLVSPHIAFSLEQNGGYTHICYIDRLENNNKAIYAEIAMTSLLTIARSLSSRDHFIISEAHFRHAEPSYADEYKRIFKAPVIFSSKQTKIVVNTKILEKPLLGALPEANRKIELEARAQLMQLHQSQKVSRQIIQYLEENLGQTPISIQDVADHLKMTPRTLQRRLRDEDTSYVLLREKVRFRFAQNYLKDDSMNMDSIADLLGFSESTNFYHAFKRWSGVSPGEFRKRLKLENRS
jgi:AraC-like DNA-binding protein